MDIKRTKINGVDMDVYSFNTVIVGSGAAGFNAADMLCSLGQNDICMVTEGINMGTSRNTGSDKQTYYKLSLSGGTPDSVHEMAQTLFDGGSMHGDIALAEAALSARTFCRLAEIGVPFPHNRYGEYIGYKTDHDPCNRATSAGPLTSRFMTEKLEQQVRQKKIRIFDGYLVISILTSEEEGERKSVGLLAIDKSAVSEENMGFTLFNCTNIIYATGGPAGMYDMSVYPQSQTGANGIAFEAGARGINLTESQFGIASVKFRWNLSGTYQQVIPRYVSTDRDGKDEREFLDEFFPETGKVLDAIFLKGYQWPFDPRKVENYGSSLIDILVFNEMQNRGRRVFLDYTRNPACGSINGSLDFSLLDREAYDYLEKSGALFGNPLERLEKMNKPAIDLYLDNGIDLAEEYLEIAVCAQHNNGGLAGNVWWESNIKHFFPAGEANGTFGVYRPGGTALCSTQTGSLRAAQYIAANYRQEPPACREFQKKVYDKVSCMVDLAKKIIYDGECECRLYDLMTDAKKRMTRYGAHIRTAEGCDTGIKECLEHLENFTDIVGQCTARQLIDVFRYRDILLSQFVYLNTIKEYISNGGKSRGSYLIADRQGVLPVKGLPEEFRFCLDDGVMSKYVFETGLDTSSGAFRCSTFKKRVRPVPKENNWFETVWNEYRNNNIIR